MAEEIKRNKLKIPVSPEESKTEIEDVANTGFTTPKTKKNIAEKKNKPEDANKASFSDTIKSFLLFYNAEQTQRIVGLFYIFSAVYIGVACASYLFTWQVDQDKVMAPSSYLFSPEVRVQNWFGKMGALLSHLFMYKWFGVSSFLFVPLLLLGGIAKAFQRNISITANLWVKATFLVIWVSVALGFVFNDKLFFLGGGFGYIISNSLQGLMGGVGLLTLLLLTLTGFIFMIFKFKKKELQAEERVIEPNTKTKTEQGAENTEPKSNASKFVFESVAIQKEEIIEEEEEPESNEIELEVSSDKEFEEKKTINLI